MAMVGVVTSGEHYTYRGGAQQYTKGRTMNDTDNQVGVFFEALSKVQAEIDPAMKDSQNPHLRNKYADLSACWLALKVVLPNHGFCVLQCGDEDSTGKPVLTTILGHKCGYSMAGAIPLLIGEHKGISAMQALGSALTYARRYGLAAICGLTAEDDDGHAAGNSAPKTREAPQVQRSRITDAQRKRLFTIATKAKVHGDTLREHIKAACGVEHSNEILVDDYKALCEWAEAGGKDTSKEGK